MLGKKEKNTEVVGRKKKTETKTQMTDKPSKKWKTILQKKEKVGNISFFNRLIFKLSN